MHYRTLGEHFDPFPSPKGAAPHAQGTFLPLSVAQQCITARSGNTSTRFRHPTGPRRTLGEHFCHYPSPNGALPHARGTVRPVSVAQGCITARLGDTYARFRRPTVPRRTPGEHFCHYPSPDSALPHVWATLTPHSVAQRCRVARSGNISATIRRPTVPRRTPGEHFCPIPSPGRAGQGKRTGRSEYGGRTGGGAGGRAGGRKRQRDGDGNGNGNNRVGGKH